MLSEHDNKLLSEVGPGRPMGELLRRFWVPVLLSQELPGPDCTPVATRIMGEDLIAFRDTNGKVGVMDAYCAHRHAHLYWGRNEECGLQCTYHGWKYDTEGNCIDMPNEPAESNFKDKIKITAYPTREAGGCVWAYMGPKELMPPQLPQFEWLRVPASHVLMTKRLQESNWAQAVEGGIDSSHISFLHSRVNAPSLAPDGRANIVDRSPRFWTSPRDFGFMVAARRNAPDNQYYWRLTPFLLPSSTIIPPVGNTQGSLGGHFWVPIDDHNCWTFTMTWNSARPLTQEEIDSSLEGFGIHSEVNKNVSRWDLAISNAYEPIRNIRNNYRINREEQRSQTFTGIKGISEQDMSIQESMGRIAPRWKEHLGTTDKAIIEFRKVLLEMLRDLQEGKEPEQPHTPEIYRVRSASFVIGRDVSWEEASTEHVRARV